MKIILKRKEDEQLRPNDLMGKLIDKIRQCLAEKRGRDQTVDVIESYLQEYDRDMERSAKNDTFRLWPQDKNTGAEQPPSL